MFVVEGLTMFYVDFYKFKDGRQIRNKIQVCQICNGVFQFSKKNLEVFFCWLMFVSVLVDNSRVFLVDNEFLLMF